MIGAASLPVGRQWCEQLVDSQGKARQDVPKVEEVSTTVVARFGAGAEEASREAERGSEDDERHAILDIPPTACNKVTTGLAARQDLDRDVRRGREVFSHPSTGVTRDPLAAVHDQVEEPSRRRRTSP